MEHEVTQHQQSTVAYFEHKTQVKQVLKLRVHTSYLFVILAKRYGGVCVWCAFCFCFIES